MKKTAAVSALLLVLVFLAQIAFASSSTLGLTFWYNTPSIRFDQDNSVLFNQLQNTTAPDDAFQLGLSPLHKSDPLKREMLQASFQSHFSDHFGADYQPDPGFIRKTLFLDINLYQKDASDPHQFSGLGAGSKLSPVFPLSAVVPEGVSFKNLRVFHGEEADSSWTWGDPESAVIYLDSSLNMDNSASVEDLTVCKSDFFVQLSVKHFSPFAIVWDEPAPSVLAAISSLPNTGDDASLAPWLVLLGGASLLLILAKKKSAASA